MLKNENIICISSIDWDFIWQGHQEIMSNFAKNDNKVLFIENTGVRVPTIWDFPRIKKRFFDWFKGIGGIRKATENLYIFSPIVLPFPYFRLARWINRKILLFVIKRWMKVMNFADPIIWTFLPTGLSLDLMNNIDNKLTIYYCIDSFASSSFSARKIVTTEQDLIKQADLVFVTAQKLYDHCIKYNDHVYIFPFGVNIENFEKIGKEKEPQTPEDIKTIKKPIIGYIGGIHKWIDQKLIKDVAKSCPEYSFVFVGPIQTNVSALSGIKNIYFLGNKMHDQLPYYVSCFNVGIIPYKLTDYTMNVYPTKLNEYLALGKPVVSTNLLEIEAFNKRYENVVSIASNGADFSACLKRMVNNIDDDRIKKMRIRIADDNTWEKRIVQMSDLTAEGVERKKRVKEMMWQENLIKLYRKTYKNLMKVTVICFLTYSLFFYTPFVWFLASPLRISQTPKKADVIVVFGGGVGEGGSPGKSTIERARYAADLYKKGYANYIIFSSGYSYKYNDAENMKLIALAEGIPEEKIILEQNANSTYENVKFTKEILGKHNSNSILLITSPYNMRRTSLSFKKLNKDLNVIYTPVEFPEFYYRGKKVKLEQIKAIMHEYLGIIYYWWKGYI